jgi:hypothetical protein
LGAKGAVLLGIQQFGRHAAETRRRAWTASGDFADEFNFSREGGAKEKELPTLFVCTDVNV